MNAINRLTSPLLDAYGALFLARRRSIGALVLAATFFDPATGGAGLAAGIAAMAARALLRLPPLPGQSDLLTAIYAGLALGAFYGGTPAALALAAFGGALAIPVSAALRQLIAPGGRGLPLLGAPFLATAWTLLAAAKGLALPLRWQWPAWPEGLSGLAASVLANVGALFYVAHPLAGLLVLAALLAASRIAAVLALAGGLMAQALVLATTPAPAAGLTLLAAFNGALTAMFVGGFLAAPGLRACAVAAGGVLAATALSAAMLALAQPLGMPPLSAPFVLTVWLVHAALRPEAGAWWARFWLPVPAAPEESLSAGRLAAARGFPAGSVGLLPPFHGVMEVAQGCDGELTHRGPWRYALDFVRTVDGLSYGGDGLLLADFHAFDQPVLAPAWGVVVACRGDVADNAPGEMNLADNWGNYVVIDIGGGVCVLLAHLRQGSLETAVGRRVAPGEALARIGNSGRSAQPHLHLHVQLGALPGAPTVPFHLTRCLVDDKRYALDAVPQRGQTVEPAAGDAALARALMPAHGRVWSFHGSRGDWQVTAETGLLGETTLVSAAGGRIQVSADGGLFALHGRSGARDEVLDAFALAFGLTPSAARTGQWRDAPAAALLPLAGMRRFGAWLANPFGASLESRYERRWDSLRGLWRQTGRHRLAAACGLIEAHSVGWISEALGPVAFSLSVAGRRVLDADLAGYGNRGDHGVPAWSRAEAKPALP